MRNIGINYSTVQLFAVMYLVVWSVSPFMEVDLIYRILAVVAAGIWFIFLMLRQNPLVLDSKQVMAIVFLFSVIGVVFIETGKASEIIKQISYFMLAICFVICLYYQKQWQELSIVIPVVLILFIVFNVKTGNVLMLDPTIARSLVRDDEEMYVYLRQGIGGYSLIYPQVCVFPAFVQWTVQAFRKNKIFFLLGAVYIGSYIYVILNAGYSIAIFTTVLGLLLQFVYKGNSAIRAVLIAMTLFVSLMLAIVYIESFRNWMLNTFQHNAIQHKINDLVATSESGATEGSLESRMIRYRASVELFYKYPIIGSLWRDSGGGHSAILDTFAKYGLWGGYMYCYMIFHVPNQFKKSDKHIQTRRCANACMVSIIFVALLDSFPYAFMATILLVLPLLLENIDRWIGEKNENSLVG
jgi:hypothetical protein